MESINKLKKINSKEYKKIIIDILKYIDKICRENDIKYTLIGGSLIGAIREKKILLWDDDIDIVLNKKEYDKLLNILIKDKKSNYVLNDYNLDKSYPITYAKLIDKRTIVIEPNAIDIDNYGAFVDIFVNHYTSNNQLFRRIHYLRCKFYQKLINGCLCNEKYASTEKGLKKIRTNLAKFIGIEKLHKRYNKLITKYDNNKKSDYVIKDYIYSNYYKDVLDSKYFDEYIDVDFEDMKAMSLKKYDSYLKHMFGDYMKRPSKENQISHSIVAYWKE